MRIWKEFGIKTHNFTNPLLVHISAHNLQTKAHSITLTTHTNENKQFWPYVQDHDYYQNIEIQCF